MKYIIYGLLGALTIFVFLFSAVKIYSAWYYKKRPWVRLHNHAMRYFAGVCGMVTRICRDEGRPYTKEESIREFFKDVAREHHEIDFSPAWEKKGEYFYELLLSHPELRSTYPPEFLEVTFKDICSSIELCPQLFIARMIEYFYGREEAAKYAYDIITGKLK